jgi:hypothetical protein
LIKLIKSVKILEDYIFQKQAVKFYEKDGNYENDIKENKHNMNIGSLKIKSF